MKNILQKCFKNEMGIFFCPDVYDAIYENTYQYKQRPVWKDSIRFTTYMPAAWNKCDMTSTQNQ